MKNRIANFPTWCVLCPNCAKFLCFGTIVGASGSALQMGNLLSMAGNIGRAVESFHPELFEDDDELSDGEIVDSSFRNHHRHHLAAGIE